MAYHRYGLLEVFQITGGSAFMARAELGLLIKVCTLVLMLKCQYYTSAVSSGLDDTRAAHIGALRVPRGLLQDRNTAMSQLQARSGVSQRRTIG
jgi:hypothetical protein